jgi:hypothetical protein
MRSIEIPKQSAVLQESLIYLSQETLAPGASAGVASPSACNDMLWRRLLTAIHWLETMYGVIHSIPRTSSDGSGHNLRIESAIIPY